MAAAPSRDARRAARTTRSSAPSGEHAVVSRLQSLAYERMIPLNVSLELTLKCNIRCLHCYNFDRDTARAGQLRGRRRVGRGPSCRWTRSSG